MSTLTYLTSAAIRDGLETIEGEVVSRPALYRTDGVNLTYSADVRISTEDPNADPVLGGPGAERVLRNVAIAVGVRDVVYAEVGAAVALRRHGPTGRFEITGFAKRKPGKRIRVAVDLVAGSTAIPEDVGISVRLLTLGELGSATYGTGFGTVPLGAFGVFRGTTLLRVQV